MSKSAIISGVNGQDGAYLAKLLLQKGYHVVGGIRSSSSSSLTNLELLGISNHIEIFEIPLTSSERIGEVFEQVRPDEFYNLAGLSSVSHCWEQPELAIQINTLGVLRILEAIRAYRPDCKFYQASSSEMFGQFNGAALDENSPFFPNNPYGVSKAAAFNLVTSYRNSFNVFGANGILFNHESPLRPSNYVSRKISRTLCKVKLGLAKKMKIGNLDIKRDWGFAPEYVEGMYRLLQHKIPTDIVFATGKSHSIREFINQVAGVLGFDLGWSGAGMNEYGFDCHSGERIVEVDPTFYRPADTLNVIGNPQKAERLLNWSAQTKLQQIAEIMVSSDLNDLAQLDTPR